MIAKHIPMRAKKQSDYAGLVRYLLDPQSKNERVGQARVTNCESMDPSVAAIEVLNTQSQNQRATGDKTYHLILSFRAGEEPDAAVLRALEARVCAALGFAEHQRVSVVHHDTDNLHVHVAINKIHPVRHTMNTPFNDHITLGKVCQKLEREFGLQQDNHTSKKRRAENEVDDMEQHAGIESLLGWIKRECWGDIQRAGSWEELHAVLSAHGLQLKAQGNGLVILSCDGTAIKASSLSRSFSKAKLEERFGGFEPETATSDEQTPSRSYEGKPIGFANDTAPLYERYKSGREQWAQGGMKEQELAVARDRKDHLIAGAKRHAKLKRSAIKHLRLGRFTKKILYATVSRSLTAAIEQAHQQHAAERRQIGQKCRRLTWADWLRAEAQRGNADALEALRSREKGAGDLKNSLSGQGHHRPGVAGSDSVTKHGTVIICAGTTVLRDDGRKLTVTRGGDQAGLTMALSVAAERYGKCLRVDGTADFRERIAIAAAHGRLDITFDDVALEARRRALIQAATQQESNHENTQQPKQRRPADSGIPADGGSRGFGASGSAKPNVGGVGKRPPPQSQNRLRKLSQLGMVRIPGGGEVLLPGDVPGHMEQQGPAADHRLRRPVSGVAPTSPAPNQAGKGRTTSKRKPAGVGASRPSSSGLPASPPAPSVAKHEISAIAASTKYVFEREQRRLTLPDIPKHCVYDGFLGDARFAGLRAVDGQQLALLERGGEIAVMPVDEATARRLKRMSRGDALKVGKQGAIRRKGRSR
ncbi:TraI/MobA(P) family conjugative relaxase [Duganella sp. BuS-21]|uniref:TraI/MobA(P) family conjugative relaxase n=1 Tax=Duganella sp. BuS-21 TaxID=2943848 RepID=UPI0035A60E43